MKSNSDAARAILSSLALLAGLCSAAAPAEREPAGALTDEARRAIEEAIPREAPARPAKPRRLLIFDLNVGYSGC